MVRQEHPKIAIVGGGPGGLTLARLLYLRGMTPIVFEADSGPQARTQGGSLDLHTETGLAALAAAGLMSGFDRVARPEDQGVRLYDRDGVCVFDDGDQSHDGRPEIDRAQLRELLLDALPDNIVRWNSRVQAIEPLGDGYRVHLPDGAAEDFDLIVGAEGTWSKTRTLLTDIQPDYSGFGGMELTIHDIDQAHPHLAKILGRGKFFALSDEMALIGQRNAHAKAHVYFMLKAPSKGLPGIDLTQPNAAREGLLNKLSGWSSELTGFITAAADEMVWRPLYAFATDFQWEHRSGITLLGDAAHVMSPFAGEGVNNAMFDALELSQAICAPNWRAGVRAYEEAMFARIPESARASDANMQAFLAPDGLMQAHSIFLSFGAGA